MRPVYTETVRWPAWFNAILGAVVILMGVGAVRTLLREGGTLAALFPLPLAALFGYVWWHFRCLVLEVGPGEVRFGFGRAGRRVPAERIEAMEPEAYSFLRYMGWGWRLGWTPRDRAWSVLGHRRGVRLRYRDAKGALWSVFVSSGDPERACAALQGKKS